MKSLKWTQAQIASYTACLATLLITPILSFEPINLGKMMALSVGAFSLIPFVFLFRMNFLNGRLRIPVFMLFVIIFFSTISSLLTETSFTAHFWGQFGRNNGLLTLISLSILFLSGLLSDELIRKRALDTLQMLSVPLSIYGGFQNFGLDPIPWSQSGIYSTLGNINFSSAFFALCAVSIFSQNVFLRSEMRFRSLRLIYGTYLTLLSMATGSIQGPVMVTVGLLLIFFVRFWEVINLRKFLAWLAVVFVAPTITVLLGLFGRGPLGQDLVQQTLLFRSDYWRAGMNMIFESPFFGYGPDGYGDWYTRARDILAVERTGPERISNTAHNVFIDIGVGGGLCVFLFIIMLVIVPVVVSGLQLHKDKEQKYSGNDKVIFVFVFVYFLQASISINQIGLAVWGWLFLGFLWSIILNEKDSRVNVSQKSSARMGSLSEKSIMSNPSSLPPGLHLFRILCISLGLSLAIIPFRADVLFANALQSKNEILIIETSSSLGATQVHAEKALSFLLSLNSANQLEFATLLTKRFPSSMFAWRVVRDLSVGPLRTQAEEQLRLLDPLNEAVLD